MLASYLAQDTFSPCLTWTQVDCDTKELRHVCRKGSSSVQVQHWLDEQSNMDLSDSSSAEEKEMEDNKMKDKRKVRQGDRIFLDLALLGMAANVYDVEIWYWFAQRVNKRRQGLI